MQKLMKAKRFLVSIAITVGAGVSALQDPLMSNIPGVKSLSPGERLYVVGIISFFAIMILVMGITACLTAALGRYRWFRAIFMGTDHIEGGWLDIVYDSNKQQIIAGGLVYIFIRDDQIHVKGETFNQDGSSGGQFVSTMAEYEAENQTLRFIYNIELSESGIREMDGYGQYSYHSDGYYPPRYFWGYFYVNGLQDRYDVYGEKLSRADAKQFISSSRLPDRGKAVQEFIQRSGDTILRQGWRGGSVDQTSAAEAP